MKICPRTQSGKHEPTDVKDIEGPYGKVYVETPVCAYCGLILDNYEKNTA